MCEYCEGYRSERYLIRNNFADDNFCEYLRENDCEDCNGCAEYKNYFEVNYYDDCMSLSTWREIKVAEGGSTVISGQNSERIIRNFCHNCGRKLR